VNLHERIENLFLSLWVGCLVGVGYIAAPVLFKTLDDRSLAGNLAGQMFYIVAVVGLVIGISLFLSYQFRTKKTAFREWRFWVLGLMVLCVAMGFFVLQPIIADIKALGIEPGSENAKRFGILHGVSSVLYLVTTLSGVVLLFAGIHKKKHFL